MFAEVILPLSLNATFTYHVAAEHEGLIKMGSRVIVPFGRQKRYTGIVASTTHIAPRHDFEIKEIEMVLDPEPIIRHPQLKFWNWLAEYYMSSIGDVYRAALPAGLKIESETRIELAPEVEPAAVEGLNDKHLCILNLLEADGALATADLEKKTGFTNIAALVAQLLERQLVIVSEKLVERYRVKHETYVRLAPGIKQADAFAAVKGAKKQEMALLALLKMEHDDHAGQGITRAALLEASATSAPILNAMAKKGIIEIYRVEVSRFKYSGPQAVDLPTLSKPQEQALRAIHQSFFKQQITLLHGVTASGKTEIYLHLIDFVLKGGNQVLYLVPEIALTTQLTQRLQRVFGKKVIIYHSRFSDAQRVEIYRQLLNSNEPCVVIGARSAVFLPFASLGLVIVDEEHEASYKQVDPAPRYNARDAATMLARFHGAKTLLGSATPSIETYYKAQQGRYGLVSLTERYDGSQLPILEVVDLKEERKRMAMTGAFAMSTAERARTAVRGGSQVIFFHNRRGFAPMARCRQCAHVPHCERCDVSLTYHRDLKCLVCHYCGATYPMPVSCPVCHTPEMEVVGFGTERIEEQAEKIFSEARMLRMDLDSTRNKDAYSQIIDDFSAHRADILIGTQMVTKGLDFGNVTMVGVLNADSIINYPDFRSAERAFNMLEQVSGRAGRRAGHPGTVVLQTYNPTHPIIEYVRHHDYEGFYKAEVKERKLFNYPPFTRIIYVYLKHRDEARVQEMALKYAEALRQVFGNRVNGPDKPGVARVQTLYIRRIMLKVETEASMAAVKNLILDTYAKLSETDTLRGMIQYCDVDPY